MKSGGDVKKVLGNELIKKLDELQFNFYKKNPSQFESEVRMSYAAIKRSIGFTLVPEKSIKVFISAVVDFIL